MNQRRMLFVDAAAVFGGAQRSLLALLAGLKGRGLDLSLVSACEELVERAAEADIPAEFLKLRLWRRTVAGVMYAAADTLRFRAWLRTHCRARQPELLYANGIQAGLLAAMSAPNTLKLLFHHRDYRCPQRLLRTVVKRAGRTVVLSDFMLRHCRGILGLELAKRLVRVYNGFDFAELRQRAEQPSLELPADRFCVALVADMAAWKRHGLFIEALAIARRQEPAFFGVLAGGPRDPAGERLEAKLRRQAAAAGLGDDVLFCGHIPDALPLIKAVDLICSVADSEPFGRTVVEALALGTPLLIAGDGGPAEIAAGQPGVQLAEATPEAVAEGMLTAYQNRRAEAAVAADWLEQFSIQQHVDRIIKLIAELLEA